MAERRNDCNGVNVKFLQLNCMHGYIVMCEIGQYVLQEGIQVCLLQEPYVRMGRVCGLPAGTRMTLSESGRASIAVFDPSYECLTMNECKFKDGVCMWLKGAVGEIFVVSLYCGVNERVTEGLRFLDNVLKLANGKRVLVGTDANATSGLWFSKNRARNWYSVKRGVDLEEWILSKGMDVLNQHTAASTFSGASGESDVDVTLFKGRSCRCVWQLKDEWGVSDHNPILISITVDESERVRVHSGVKRWNARKCNWKTYESLIESSASSLGLDEFKGLTAEDKVRTVYEWIEEANNKCMKRTKNERNRKGVVWWNESLEDKKREVRKKRKVYQRERKRSDVSARAKWIEYKECEREYKEQIKRAKEDDWHDFVRKEGARDPWGRVYKICMGKSTKCVLSGLRTADGWTRTWSESAGVLMNEFFPSDDGVPIPPREEGLMNELREYGTNDLECAIKRMRMGKTPGIDGITNEMIKHVWYAVPQYLRCMYNSCLQEGLFPTQWKEARVVALLKSEEKDKAEPRSYRPISLLSGLGKVLERMMIERLMILMDGRWNESQYGFMNGKGTDDALMKVKCMVHESVSKHVLGMFVDFKGAFDYLLWRVIVERLMKIGCKDEDLRLWYSYFKDRWVRMYNGMEEIKKRVERGCPQGSISGPSVWNLGMNELLDELTGMNVKVVAYADDLLIVIEGETRRRVEERAGEVMKVVYTWGAKAGVDVSDSKTVCMVLKGGLNMLNRPISVDLEENDVRKIKCVEKVKYLGVWMSKDMNFRVHVSSLKEKVERMTGKLRRVMRKEWGLRKSVISVIVKGLLLPAVMYGAIVWYELVRLKQVREDLIRRQRYVLYACTRVCKTVSTEAMQVIAGSLPWDIECIRQANRYKTRKGLRLNEIDLVADRDLEELDRMGMLELIDKRANEIWQHRWDESRNGRVTYEWIKDVTFSGRTKQFDPSLRVGYILTGHGSLNAFLFSRNLEDSPACICGNASETWLHVLCECDMYAAFRDLDEMNIVRRVNKWDVSMVLSERATYERLCAFVKRAYEMRASVIARTDV